ncbi:hypothetical protein K457DRAFT_197440 [Linnemannia elongata AG-77]|uniref:Uncharacterized protein n=1 Tax=Linnemannia elongata AG-77 TaxID=1314771 RepID=A0A197JFF1_9FUNG|nr:hypothetical protein K457DRAFT_197440 [Linnemannia elongata AG-77]
MATICLVFSFPSQSNNHPSSNNKQKWVYISSRTCGNSKKKGAIGNRSLQQVQAGCYIFFLVCLLTFALYSFKCTFRSAPHRFSFIPCTRQVNRAVQVQQELSSLLKYLLLTIAQVHRSNWARNGQRPARLLVYIYEQRGDKEGADNRTTHHLHLYHRLFIPFLFAPAEFHLFLFFFPSHFAVQIPSYILHTIPQKLYSAF